jgi:hypothetical protein
MKIAERAGKSVIDENGQSFWRFYSPPAVRLTPMEY